MSESASHANKDVILVNNKTKPTTHLQAKNAERRRDNFSSYKFLWKALNFIQHTIARPLSTQN